MDPRDIMDVSGEEKFLSLIGIRNVDSMANSIVAIRTKLSCIFLSITNKMQCYTIFFIIVNALNVSGGFFAHHQELKNCTHSIGYMSSLLAATASGSSKQA